ncbi:hypothetical protein [Terrarubrum flagellatum]|uniref:hypothetical protein n=1 Tax=Terrirubrum flagellatum TaxID=2895980 RepID=UPI00314534D3
MLRTLITRFAGDTSGEMLKTAAKAVAITSVFSVTCAYFLANGLDSEKRVLEMLAESISQRDGSVRAARAGVDMTTTGSIRSQSVRLDPCAVPDKR